MFKTIMKYARNYKAFFLAILAVGLYTYSKIGNRFLPIEQLMIPSAIGVDIIKKGEDIIYSVPISVYNYEDEKVSSIVLVGKGDTLTRTRGDRQFESHGKFLVGLEKALVASEDFARFDLNSWLDILWSTKTVNDTAFMVVSKQSAEDILNFKMQGFPSSGDYIHSLVERLADLNFFSTNYKLIDVFIRADSEGRNILLPYLEIVDNKLRCTGLAVFKGTKLALKADIDDARTLSLLRENNVTGIIQLVKSPMESLALQGTSSRKVRCNKVNDKYVFDIEVEIKGEVSSNLLYDNLVQNTDAAKVAEKELAREVERLGNEFVKKMQSEYKIDVLELGKCAVEKYGRGKDIDWDEVVSQSQINISAKVKITEIGRGDF
jgi:Ger(x)C family germination protein